MDLINTLLIKKELDLIAWGSEAPRLRAPEGDLLIRGKAILIVPYQIPESECTESRGGSRKCFMGWQKQSKQAFDHLLDDILD